MNKKHQKLSDYGLEVNNFGNFEWTAKTLDFALL
jgi:hypothetical protein